MSIIQRYLQDFAETIPAHLRAEALAEVRSHLEELVREGQRQGLARAVAEEKAVSQFGAARKIGVAWRRAAGVVDWYDILLAALPILGITGLGWFFVGQHIPLFIYLVIFGGGAAIALWRSWPTWWYAWLGWLFLALLVVPETKWLFFISFPLLVTLLAVDHWEQATLMTLPFTTFVAFTTIIERQHLVTTGWGPGHIYPGNIIWLETAFSVLWVLILAASLRTARPTRRGVYLLAGLVGTQLIYIGAVILMVILGKTLPAYFILNLSTTNLIFYKLPMGLLSIGLTIYPFFIWLLARWVGQRHPQSGLTA